MVRPVAAPLTRLLIRARIPADAVSVSKGLVGVAGAVAFAFPGRAWLAAGILLLQVSFLLDACDGAVARATGTCARTGGEFLDKLGDATMRSVLYLCWGAGAWASGGRVAFLFAGGLMAGLWLVVRFCLVETLLENLASRGAEGPEALEREQEALGRAFITGGSRARGFEGFLSAFFHPFINLVTLLSIPEFFVTGFSPGGFAIHAREGAFAAYFLLWAANWLRKIPWHHGVADVRR